MITDSCGQDSLRSSKRRTRPPKPIIAGQARLLRIDSGNPVFHVFVSAERRGACPVAIVRVSADQFWSWRKFQRAVARQCGGVLTPPVEGWDRHVWDFIKRCEWDAQLHALVEPEGIE